ncbi:MAG: hypothetical protein HQL69_18485 [Magnetococcales bacterium]|nr:hypothetical protein [Magnetococcales bacterium]
MNNENIPPQERFKKILQDERIAANNRLQEEKKIEARRQQEISHKQQEKMAAQKRSQDIEKIQLSHELKKSLKDLEGETLLANTKLEHELMPERVQGEVKKALNLAEIAIQMSATEMALTNQLEQNQHDRKLDELLEITTYTLMQNQIAHEQAMEMERLKSTLKREEEYHTEISIALEKRKFRLHDDVDPESISEKIRDKVRKEAEKNAAKNKEL